MLSVALTWPQVHRGSSHVSFSMPARMHHRLRVRLAAPVTDSRSILKRHPTSFVLAYFRSFQPPRVLPGISSSNPQYKSATHGPIHFAVATQSSGTATTSDAPVFMPTDHISGFIHEDAKKVGYETA